MTLGPVCARYSWHRLGTVVALDNDILVTSSPNARYRQGEVYVYRKPPGPTRSQYFVLDQVSLASH